MLYETLKQSYIFFGMLYFGLLAGVLYEVKLLIEQVLNKKIFQITLDILFCIIFGLIFIYATSFTNYGEIRLFIILSYLIGFFIVRISVGSVLAKVFNFLYNNIIKLIKKINLPKFLRIKQKIDERKNAKKFN